MQQICTRMLHNATYIVCSKKRCIEQIGSNALWMHRACREKKAPKYIWSLVFCNLGLFVHNEIDFELMTEWTCGMVGEAIIQIFTTQTFPHEHRHYFWCCIIRRCNRSWSSSGWSTLENCTYLKYILLSYVSNKK